MFIKLTSPLIVAICATFVHSAAIPKEEAVSCGYQSCNPIKEGFINVHLVPHTHDDVGWLKTVDQYFYGTNNTIQKAGVQYILDTVIEELRKDATRRFIYVETAFFWKWWIHQHDAVKHQVKKFVNNGQLEFIGGAWSMNDEATTHYHSIIDQFTWGLRKLNDTFGTCGRPKIGWQIDPFGHSREMASIFAQLGFDGLLLGRIDWQDKRYRFDTKTAEMVWQGSSNLDKSKIFTGVMYNTYGPPPGFCFDMMCNDEPLVDDQKSPLYNIERRIDELFEYLVNASKVYATKNLIITMGEDFHYQDANIWFKNLDKLIYYANLRQQTGSPFNLFYSTPSCYVKAVHDEAVNSSKKWLVKTDDFFPYSSDQHAFWTGYFTSRPTIKRFEREGNNFLQVCKQLYALTDLGPEDWVDLNALREAMGVMQHHDAITGTEKQHVARDYARILQKGIEECQFITNTALSKIIAKESTRRAEDPAPTVPITTCQLTNISSCPFTETQDNFVVTVYNPLSRPVTKYVRLPVLNRAYKVQNPDGQEVLSEILPIPKAILNVPGRDSKATQELIFEAGDVPPLGFKSYYVTKSGGDKVVKKGGVDKRQAEDISFQVNPTTGRLSSVTMNGITLKADQEFLNYKGFIGDNAVATNRSSGAYIFRPLPGNEPSPLSDSATYEIYRGQLVSEVHQTVNEWASQVIRIYAKENFVEFDWLIGPIPHNDPNGKEVVSRFRTGLSTNSTFYTDSNGRELLERVRNFRPTWRVALEEPVAGNYYPVTSKIVLVDSDEDVEVAVLTDRAQGGGSLQDGDVELMVHRNCLHDDAFGVGEALNETAFGEGLVARGSHYLIVGPHKNKTGSVSTAASERDVAQRKLLDSWIFLSSTQGTASFEDYKTKYVTQYAGLKKALPDNVQILTLEPWKGFSFLLRLEHVLEKAEDSVLSQPATVDLQGLFSPFEIISIKETTLAANQWLEENDRLEFETGDTLDSLVPDGDASWEQLYDKLKRNGLNKRAVVVEARDYPEDLKITLTPMQIRTFVIDIKKNE